MSGDIKEQAVQITWKGVKVTAKVLMELIKAYLVNKKVMVHGEQSLKKLNIQNKQLESVKISGSDINAFKKELKKYSVDFNVQKDRNTGEFVIFFKGQDIERVHKGLENCVKNFDNFSKKCMKDVMEQATKKAAEKAADKDSQKHENKKEQMKCKGMER